MEMAEDTLGEEKHWVTYFSFTAAVSFKGDASDEDRNTLGSETLIGGEL